MGNDISGIAVFAIAGAIIGSVFGGSWSVIGFGVGLVAGYLVENR